MAAGAETLLGAVAHRRDFAGELTVGVFVEPHRRRAGLLLVAPEQADQFATDVS
jgi:hypothetical protein